MPPVDPADVLTAVADRVAAQVAAYGDRVAVDRAPQGNGAWDLTDGPHAVVAQTGPSQPALGGDGDVLVEEMRVGVAVWQAPADTSDVVPATASALASWTPASGIRPTFVGVYRVPQPEEDVLRTEVEVRYAHKR